MSAVEPAAEPLDHVLLAERLAIVDEIHNDVAHALATAAIHLGLLDPDRRGRPAGAPAVAQAACQRALEGVRRARRMAPDEPLADPESVGADLGHLHALATVCEATAIVTRPLPAAESLAAGALVTVSRVAEGFLRLTAGRGAIVRVTATARCLRVEADSDLPPSAWTGDDPDLERIRERLRWFDGRLDVAPRAQGSRAVAELPR